MIEKTLPYLTGRFFDGISSGLFMLALPWIMLQSPDMGTFVALTALACTAVTFLLTPYFSTLIDRHSRKIILVLMQMVQSFTALLVCIIYWLEFGSHWILALSQLVFWVTSNVAWHANNAFTQENFAPHQYAKLSGHQEVIMQSTTLGAGALGVILLEQWGIFEFAVFAAIASGIAVASYQMTPYKRQVRQSIDAPLLSQIKEVRCIYSQESAFYGFILISCLSYPVLTFLGKLIPIWFAELNVSGEWFALYNIMWGLGSLGTGLLFSRILASVSHKYIMQYSIMVLASILLVLSGVSDPLYVVVLMFCFGFFNALNRIARVNWMHHRVALSQRGRVDGGLAMFTALVQSLSYVLIAFLAHISAIEVGFLVIGLIMSLCGLWMIRLGRGVESRSDFASEY